MGPQGERPQGLVERLAEAEWHGIEVKLARLDLGEVEDVVEHRQQRVGGGLGQADVLALGGRERRPQRQLGHPEDAIHRRADLVAHVGQEFALGPGGRLGHLSGMEGFRLGPATLDDLLHEGLVGAFQLGGAFRHRLFEPIPARLEFRLATRHATDRPERLEATEGEDHHLEEHPRGVLDPPPVAGDQDPEDRSRPVEAPKVVIQTDHHGGGRQHPPVAVEGQEGERSEYVKMGLDPAPREVDQEGTQKHLGDRHGLAGGRPARADQSQYDRQADGRPAQ